MNLRRILILAGVLLILFLGMYSWNQRTHALDDIAAAVGLEVKELFTIQADTTPLAPATIHSYHRTISSILERAVKWKCIPSNPAERAELPSLAGHKARYLDEPDAKRM